MSRFADSEIVSLIDEVGQVIELCHRKISSAGDPDAGIPSRASLDCRQIKAYIVSRDAQIFLQGVITKYGYLECYILGSEVEEGDIDAQTLVRYDDRLYQIEYQNEVKSQGTIVLHDLKLTAKQFSHSTESAPDGVLRLPPPEAPRPPRLLADDLPDF